MENNDRLRIGTTLKLVDGTSFEGDMILPIGGAVERTLNNDAKFILINDNETGDRYISKTVIAEVLPRRRK